MKDLGLDLVLTLELETADEVKFAEELAKIISKHPDILISYASVSLERGGTCLVFNTEKVDEVLGKRQCCQCGECVDYSVSGDHGKGISCCNHTEDEAGAGLCEMYPPGSGHD